MGKWTIDINGTNYPWKKIHFTKAYPTPDPDTFEATLNQKVTTFNYFDYVAIRRYGVIKFFGYIEEYEYSIDEAGGTITKIRGRCRKLILWKKYMERYIDTRLEGFFGRVYPFEAFNFLIRCPKSDVPNYDEAEDWDKDYPRHKIGWGISSEQLTTYAEDAGGTKLYAAGTDPTYPKLRISGFYWRNRGTISNIITRVPDGTAGAMQWTEVGAAGAACINSDDGDTTYIWEWITNDLSYQYTFQNLGGTASGINSVVLHVKLKKWALIPTWGSYRVLLEVYDGTAWYEYGHFEGKNTYYQDFSINVTDLINTVAEFNAMRVRFTLIWNGGIGAQVRITYAYVVVDYSTNGTQNVNDKFIVDLGELKERVCGIIVQSRYSSDQYARNYVVEYSIDGVGWSEIASCLANTAQDIIHSWKPRSIRYLRLRITVVDTTHAWEITQVYVYQADDADYTVLESTISPNLFLSEIGLGEDFFGVSVANGGWWTIIPAILGNSVDLDLATSSTEGQCVQAADNMAYTTWDLGALKTLNLYVKIGYRTLGGGVQCTVRLKGSTDGIVWTTIDTKTTFSLIELSWEESYENQTYRYYRVCLWGTLAGPVAVKYYEIASMPIIEDKSRVTEPFNMAYQRLTDGIDQLAFASFNASYLPLEWWIDEETGVVYFGGTKGTDKSAIVQFIQDVHIRSSSNKYSIKKTAQRIRVIGKGEGRRQDEVTSNWQIDAAAIAAINSFYEELISEKSISYTETATEWAKVWLEKLKDIIQEVRHTITYDPYNLPYQDYDVGDTITTQDTRVGIASDGRQIKKMDVVVTSEGEVINLTCTNRWEDIADRISNMLKKIRKLEFSSTGVEDWTAEGQGQAKIKQDKLENYWDMKSKYDEARELTDLTNEANQTTYWLNPAGWVDVNVGDIAVSEEFLSFKGPSGNIGGVVSPEVYIGDPATGNLTRVLTWKRNPRFMCKVKITGSFVDANDYIIFGMDDPTIVAIQINRFGFYIEWDGASYKLRAISANNSGMKYRDFGTIAEGEMYELEAHVDWDDKLVFFSVGYENGSKQLAVIPIDDNVIETDELAPMWVKGYLGGDGVGQAGLEFYLWKSQGLRESEHE